MLTAFSIAIDPQLLRHFDGVIVGLPEPRISRSLVIGHMGHCYHYLVPDIFFFIGVNDGNEPYDLYPAN